VVDSTKIFNRISKKLSEETDLQNQLSIVVAGAMDLANADAGTLYSVSADKALEDQFLKFEVVLNRTLKINKQAPHTHFPNISLYKKSKPNSSMVVVNCVLEEISIFIDDIYDEKQYNFSGTRIFDLKKKYKTHSLLTVPILDFKKKVIGVIQLINAKDDDNNIRVFNEQDQKRINLFVAQTAFTLSSKILIDKQKALFSSINNK